MVGAQESHNSVSTRAVGGLHNMPIALHIVIMRTTIELSDALATRVQAHMKKHRTTLRALVEESLNRVLEEPAADTGFVPRDAAFDGKQGFAAEFGSEDLPQVLREINAAAEVKAIDEDRHELERGCAANPDFHMADDFNEEVPLD